MSILGNVRTKAGRTITVVLVGLIIGMFAISDMGGRLFLYFFSARDVSQVVGRVAGQPISYKTYQGACENIYHNFKSQGKQLSGEEQMRVKDFVWQRLVDDCLYVKMAEQIGITVSDFELNDLVEGDHIDPSVAALSLFKDPATNVFDKQRLQDFLQDLPNQPEYIQEGWHSFKKELRNKRMQKKLHHLVEQSYGHISLEEEHLARHAQTFCDVDYLYIPFATVQDDLVEVTEQQVQDYMLAHSNHYKARENKKIIQYVAFPIQPDERDITHFQKQLNELTVQFATATDSYTFAKQNTDGDLAATSLQCKGNELPDAFAKLSSTLQKEMVVGPVVREGLHTLYKVIELPNQTTDCYQLAVIEKRPCTSERTRNGCRQKAHDFEGQVKCLDDLKRLAADANIVVQEEEVSSSDTSIGIYGTAREVVRWLYAEAKVDKVSGLFDVGDAYLLVIMTAQLNKGDLLPWYLPNVYYEVHKKLLNQGKAKIVVDKLKQMHVATLEELAKAYSSISPLTLQSVKQLNFLDNEDRQLNRAKVFIGKCFSLLPDVISEPIVDQEGVFIACVKNRYHPDLEKGKEIEKKYSTRMQQEQWMQVYELIPGIKEVVKIRDERYRFE